MKVLIADKVDNLFIDTLKSNQFYCDYEPDIGEGDIIKKIAEYDGIILKNKISFKKDLIDKAENLKFIGILGPDLKGIDVEYAISKEIICFDAPEAYSDAVGEHALAMLLNLFNYLCRANLQLKNGIWKREDNKGRELNGKTIGIIGYGNTGSAFAKKISGFDVNILSYDKFKTNYSDGYAKESTLEEIQEKVDVLSVHVPWAEETISMIDYSFLSQFKKNIYLINTSSGRIVNTEDLAKAISEGIVLGAALDVFEFERSSFEKLHFGDMPESLRFLIDSDNVIMSPHIAGFTKEADDKLTKVLAKKIMNAF